MFHLYFRKSSENLSEHKEIIVANRCVKCGKPFGCLTGVHSLSLGEIDYLESHGVFIEDRNNATLCESCYRHYNELSYRERGRSLDR